MSYLDAVAIIVLTAAVAWIIAFVLVERTRARHRKPPPPPDEMDEPWGDA